MWKDFNYLHYLTVFPQLGLHLCWLLFDQLPQLATNVLNFFCAHGAGGANVGRGGATTISRGWKQLVKFVTILVRWRTMCSLGNCLMSAMAQFRRKTVLFRQQRTKIPSNFFFLMLRRGTAPARLLWDQIWKIGIYFVYHDFQQLVNKKCITYTNTYLHTKIHILHVFCGRMSGKKVAWFFNWHFQNAKSRLFCHIVTVMHSKIHSKNQSQRKVIWSITYF